MKIQPIQLNTNYYKNNINKSLQNGSNQGVTTQPEKYDNVFPKSYVKINFKGRPIEKLWEEYDWFIRHDKTPAIFSFLKIKEAPEVMERFFKEILATADRGDELISSIVYNPRQTNFINNKLAEVLPKGSNILLPFFPTSPYNVAYTRFVENKLKTAHSIEDLLKMRPDWREGALLNKYEEIYHNRNFEIGNIPKDIPQAHMFAIVDYLSNHMELSSKPNKVIDSLFLDKRKYDFAYFTEGRSDKNVFGIFTPEGKKYVLKMVDPNKRSLDAPMALGTLAKIDAYLTYNRSRNSAPLCYYNHDRNFSIYKYMEHIPTELSSKDLAVIAKNLPDFEALGLKYNDTIGNKNFFLLDKKSSEMVKTEGFWEGVNNKEWVSVDNDHVTYDNRFQPSIEKYHAYLQNSMPFTVAN